MRAKRRCIESTGPANPISGWPRQDMDRRESREATGLDLLQLIPEHNVIRTAVRVDKQHPTRLSPIAHVSQHAHEGGDPYACGDEHQVIAVRVEDMREPAER